MLFCVSTLHPCINEVFGVSMPSEGTSYSGSSVWHTQHFEQWYFRINSYFV